jgi:hypothetical protein
VYHEFECGHAISPVKVAMCMKYYFLLYGTDTNVLLLDETSVKP